MNTHDIDLAAEIWAAAQRGPGEGIEDAIERIETILEAALQSQDREDAERYRAWRKAVASQNGNFFRLVSNELPDWNEGPVDESRVDAAIDHARRVEGADDA